eukprot:gnl/TRDRNA2_/TRDRNA2_93738_c0_seq1.p1 gnl/TRDRNA2_/TRDRNA2_93738_c0~~gnl/TRDRNA2_/TRDRNA2_93738_c0_seq1.p1  ORF type:complete len:365 (+),score=51.29 gnl/TRDRNA2_/TRDRNA2_93738_c0_seq1:189-1283(+)
MDWKLLHPKHRTPVLSTLVFPSIKWPDTANPPCFSNFQKMYSGSPFIELAKWLLHHGASPFVEAPGSCVWTDDVCIFDDKSRTLLTIEFKGHSAVSLIVELRRQMIANQAKLRAAGVCESLAAYEGPSFIDWEAQIKFLDEFLKLMTRQPVKSVVGVDESVLDIWQSIRADCSTHDVAFETAGNILTAHTHVLSMASPVLSTMLASIMQEGQQKHIKVEDSPAEGVSLFLDLVYTGTTGDNPSPVTILAALDLAHRWTVPGVVKMLERALLSNLNTSSQPKGKGKGKQGRSLNVEQFCEIAEAAMKKDLPDVRAACVRYAAESPEVKQCMQSKSLPAVVLEMLGVLDCSKRSPNAKKRRLIVAL